MEKGIFITIEGPEGAGKTTIIEMLLEKLESELTQRLASRNQVTNQMKNMPR